MDPEAGLPTFRLESGTAIAQTRPWHTAPVTLASPAVEVMTDLTLVKAATVAPTTSLAQAEQQMIYQGVRMLFVVSEMPSIEGLITTTDLHGERQMRLVHARGARYADLCVSDVMTGLPMLEGIDHDRLSASTVGDVVATLKRHGRQHLLVVQAATAQSPRRVRGVISRAQIERQLGSTIEIAPLATSFSELERALS